MLSFTCLNIIFHYAILFPILKNIKKNKKNTLTCHCVRIYGESRLNPLFVYLTTLKSNLRSEIGNTTNEYLLNVIQTLANVELVPVFGRRRFHLAKLAS